jgi:hypothetical protein
VDTVHNVDLHRLLPHPCSRDWLEELGTCRVQRGSWCSSNVWTRRACRGESQEADGHTVSISFEAYSSHIIVADYWQYKVSSTTSMHNVMQQSRSSRPPQSTIQHSSCSRNMVQLQYLHQSHLPVARLQSVGQAVLEAIIQLVNVNLHARVCHHPLLPISPDQG